MAIVYSEKNTNNTKIIASFKHQPTPENLVSLSFSKNIYLKKSKDLKSLRLFLKLNKSDNSTKLCDVKLYVNNRLIFDSYVPKKSNYDFYEVWLNPQLNLYAGEFLKAFKDNVVNNPIELKQTFFHKKEITKGDVFNFIDKISNEQVKSKNDYNYVISMMHLYTIKYMR